MTVKTTTTGTKPTTPIQTTANNSSVRTMRELGERAASSAGPMFSGPEPIRMVLTSDKRGDNNRYREPNGKISRAPSVAHTPDSDYTDRKVDQRTRTRYRSMIDQHGHEVFVVHSNASAHAPAIEHGRFSRDGYTEHVLRKGFALGWIDVNAGCLARQVRDGLVDVRRLVADHGAAKVCRTDATTCIHIEAERTARQARNNAIQGQREVDARSGELRRRAEDARALRDALAEDRAATITAQDSTAPRRSK